MRSGKVLFTMLLLLLMVITAEPLFAVTYGQLQGKISFSDGLGFATTSFRIITGTESRKMMSDKDGEFSAVLPTGRALIKIASFQQSVLIVEGEVTTVKLIVPRPGWVIRCVDPQGNVLAAQYGLVRYKLPSVKKNKPAAWRTEDGLIIADGLLWFATIPSNIRILQLLYSVSEGDNSKNEYQQWSFATPATSHKLTAIGAPRVQFWLFLEDGNGNRLANMPITGQMSFWQPSYSFAIFDNPAKVNMSSQPYPLADLQTDERGALFLGRCPAGKYAVSLQAGERSGLPMTVILQKNGAVGDGSVAGKTYQARLTTRTVTQTVFSSTGKVLPHALVNATYCQKQRAVYLQQQADENGVVRWSDLPPVPVITWGEGLAAAVIPAEGEIFQQPLPVPRRQQNSQAYIIFTSTSEFQGDEIIGSLSGGDCYADFSQSDIEFDEDISEMLDNDEVAIGYGQVNGGEHYHYRPWYSLLPRVTLLCRIFIFPM